MDARAAAEPVDASPGAPAEERRSAPRFQIVQRCLVRPAGGPGDASWKGIAYDLSAVGIGIALPYPLAPGTTIVIEPWELPAARPLEARVVRFVPVAHLWFCGCELTARLRDDELRAWLGKPAWLPEQPGVRVGAGGW